MQEHVHGEAAHGDAWSYASIGFIGKERARGRTMQLWNMQG